MTQEPSNRGLDRPHRWYDRTKNVLGAVLLVGASTVLAFSAINYVHCQESESEKSKQRVNQKIKDWRDLALERQVRYNTPNGMIIVRKYDPLNIDTGQIPCSMKSKVEYNRSKYAGRLTFEIPGQVAYVGRDGKTNYYNDFVLAEPKEIIEMLGGDWQGLYQAVKRREKYHHSPIDPEEVKAILQPLAPVGKEHSLGNALVFQVYEVCQRVRA
ncbi:MAG: hypothetical protein EYC62_07125 [Alphaproteobacteria bacterium]|nr:MAG: hypothetical protein EYC62_07125 [Alphaproteobacteria bacterium]